jgi:hypothetical protein
VCLRDIKADGRSSGAFLEQCRIRVHRGRDITMNCISCVNEPDITEYTTVNRLSWAGHIIHRTVKKVFDTRP